MQINTDGLVIMERTVGESDRLVTLLTREEGIIPVSYTHSPSPRDRTRSRMPSSA